MLLKNKTAIITGAAMGIGAATAELFAQQGARVMLADISEKELEDTALRIRRAGGECSTVLCDVSDSDDVHNCVDRTIGQWGRVDMLINVAGIVDLRRPVVKTDNELWDRVLAINLSGTFYFCREVLPYMERQGDGSIVNISSGAFIRSNSGAAYTAAKYAVVGLSKNIAIQYAGKGIRCNVVCPGVTDTQINSPEHLILYDKSAAEAFDKRMDWSLPMVSAQDQANAILFYCTEACKCITGQVLTVDNGCFL